MKSLMCSMVPIRFHRRCESEPKEKDMKQRWTVHAPKAFRFLEQLLTESKSSYIVGADFTIADLVAWRVTGWF